MARSRALLPAGLFATLWLVLLLATWLHNAPATSGSGDVITSPDAGGLNVSLALDASGNPVIAHTTAAGELRVVHCNDPFCAGNNESAVAVGTNAGRASLAIDSSGRPVVAYHYASGGNSDLRLLRCGNANCTSGNTTNAPDTPGNVGAYPSLALDASNLPAIAYHDESNRDLKFAHCVTVTCSGVATINVLDVNGSEGLYNAIALQANGNPMIAYHEESHSGVLRIRHCDDPNCSAGGVVVPDPVGILGLYPAIVLDAAGRAVVSYYDLSNGNLKVIHCGNINCTANNFIKIPDSTGDVGAHTSIALDGAGFAIISYYDVTNADLKVLHCGDTTCESSNSITSVDTAGNVGQYTSLRLDSAGNPVVAYRDATNGRVNVLHCNDTNCTGAQKSSPSSTATPTPTPCAPASCPDTDGDGCTDVEELGPNEQLGGRRDPANPWDFYDIDGNGLIDLFGDIFVVANAFGDDADDDPPGEPDGYDPALDRSSPPPGGDPWDTQAPDGIIDLFSDIFGVANQFGHDCSGPP